MASLPKFFSISAASTYKQCPRKWKHRYIDKLPDPPGEAALVGTFAHQVLEVLCEKEPEGRTTDEAKKIAREVWPETASNKDFQSLNLSESEEKEFRWKAWTAIDGLWKLEDPTEIDVLSTEKRISVDLNEVPFFGIVDRLDQSSAGTIVTDYKTGKPPKPAYRNKALDQIILYAAAVESETGELPAKGRLLYLGKESSEIEIDINRELISNSTGQFTETWNDLARDCAEDNFDTGTGPLCGWCPYAGICEDGQKEVRKRLEAGRMRADAPALMLI